MTDKPEPPRIEDLPLLAAAAGARRGRLEKALEDIRGYLEAGAIPNARYEDLRPGMMDRLEEAWKAAVAEPLWAIAATGREDRTLYEDGTLPRRASQLERELSLSSYEGLPAVRRLAKRFAKAREASHPDEFAGILAQGEAALAEILKVVDAMAWLQERRVKRAPPGSAPPAPELPKATRDAQSAVRTRMREVLAGLRAAFADAVVAMVRKQADRMDEVCAEVRTILAEDAAQRASGSPRGLSTYGGEGRFRLLRAQAADIRYLARHLADYEPNTYAVTRHPDGEVRARKFAEEETDRVFHLWTERNVSKLAPIVEAKGGVTIDVLRAQASSGGVETLMAVSFPDRSRFRFSNAIEYALSTRGKEFARFPARFHDAFRADGTRIRGASEAKVVGEFVPAVQAPPEEEASMPGPGR